MISTLWTAARAPAKREERRREAAVAGKAAELALRRRLTAENTESAEKMICFSMLCELRALCG
jgi:hypothetical protein